MMTDKEFIMCFAHKVDMQIDRLNGAIIDEKSEQTERLVRIRDELKDTWHSAMQYVGSSGND